jgi:adenine-specific DNA-methyltransferase
MHEIWDGDNLSVMPALDRQIDLILTDPPYNTGEDLRYNDSRHTAWLDFMAPRIRMMREMLKPTGILAICIDHRELFRLGLLLDEILGEANRLAIINWQKSTAPRSDNEHVSTSTEYVLVYAKDLTQAQTNSLERSANDNARYSNPDRDPRGDWREGNLTARSYAAKDDYAIQSPFTGALHYPAGHGAWRHPKRHIIQWLSAWGTSYEERDIGDLRRPALMMTGDLVRAERLDETRWPFVWFGRDGQGRPRVKTYLAELRKGKVPVTYWAAESFHSTSWGFRESGRTNDGIAELTAIVGRGHGFTTVKPLKLFKKIIQLWCPPDGIVLDPFAGSGTTAHAVLELNADQNICRRFVLIEQGNIDTGDHYAETLTAERVRRVITGEWASGARVPLTAGFRFRKLKRDN